MPTTEKHVFTSKGVACCGHLYLPESANPPVVVLAQGFGAECSMGTQSFIKAFLEDGIAVFAFDYRGFGGSQGKPRQLVHPGRHCQDWNSAIQYLRSLRSLDTSRMALWGSSFAGGHVLVTAARVHNLQGVIAQVPFCSGRSVRKSTPAGKTLASMGHILLDLLSTLVGREHRVAIVGRPGEGFAIMDHPGWYEDYIAITEGSPTWRNATPARTLLHTQGYNPMDSAGQIECPVLIISGARDQAIPRQDVLETAARIPRCRHVELDFDHFDLYEGFPLNAEAIELQRSFLREVLGANPRTPSQNQREAP